ncbi:uncharacterized protein LOC120147913 [Hibiscus syriacus]|uniref:uncharacterized protein LOC120147913 n=1 Tax=Hibiscus syriacus TaxID=106335 RepID=UPI0019243FA1|nr:uncharacterized protein LOC120147913 [Hibiscus syriacus]
MVCLNRIPVRIELAKRGVSSISDVSCPLCSIHPEKAGHLLFSCKKLFFQSWHEVSISLPPLSVWHIVPSSILWSVWLFRNDIVFKSGSIDSLQLSFLEKYRLASWFKAKKSNVPLSLKDIVANPWMMDIIVVWKSL